MKLHLGEIARQLDLELRGDDSLEIEGIANLADAVPGQLAFLFNSAYARHLPATRASAVVLRAADAPGCLVATLISPQPRLTWAQVARLFDPAPVMPRTIHPTAVIDATADIGNNVHVGPHVVIEADTRIADDVVLGAGCYVGARTVVGEGSRFHPNVTVYHDVQVGRLVVLHSGVVVGADGFGYEFDRSSAQLVKIAQVYGVVIGDQVEVGAGTTIDRGALNHTQIGDGVKLDNQVQVGHGTRIGAHTAISGCTAIAGSTRIGSYCLIGGAVGIVDNIEITDQVEITAMTLVSQSITEKGRYSSGTGLMSSRAWKRSIVGFSKLDELIKRVRGLEARNRK